MLCLFLWIGSLADPRGEGVFRSEKSKFHDKRLDFKGGGVKKVIRPLVEENFPKKS